MTKKFIVCPNCSEGAKHEVLAAINPDGSIFILRRPGYTDIEGTEFSIKCGRCSEKVFYRTHEHSKEEEN